MRGAPAYINPLASPTSPSPLISLHNAVFAQLRLLRGRPTRLEIERMHALTLRDEGRYRLSLTPRADQSPETRFGADCSSFPPGPRHLQETDVHLIRIGGSGFHLGYRLARIPRDSNVVIREDRVGQNRE